MTKDVAEFSNALNGVYKRFSVLEPQLQQQELRNLNERERKMLHRAEQRLQQQLQTAQSAFLQEFRNHSVVVQREVDKIREQLRTKFEEDYNKQIQCLRQQLEEERVQCEKHKAEISKLKCAATAQDAYTTAMRHRLGLDKKEELRSRIQELEDEMVVVKREGAELARQLSRRNDLVSQLYADVSSLREELDKQVANSAHERQSWEGLISGLRQEMSQQQEHFGVHLREYENKFEEYRAKTAAEMQIQEILNTRRSEALVQMEEERLLHIKAKDKPTPRVVDIDVSPDRDTTLRDPASEVSLHNPTAEVPYNLVSVPRYRVDDMGMDTSWRDYQPRRSARVPGGRKTLFPKFQVQRTPNTSRNVRLPAMSEDQTGYQPRVQPPNPLGVSTVLGPRTSI